MRYFLPTIFVMVIIGDAAMVSVADAITGEHLGEQRYLSYRVEYLSPEGVTIVDGSGFTFISECCTTHENIFLPERYWGGYPLYFAGQTLQFRVILKNKGRRTYRNLKVETFQEFLNSDGGQGKPMGENNHHTWLVERLGAGEEIILEGTFEIPFAGESGLDQTHLRISHLTTGSREKGEIILEDFQAGLWCPNDGSLREK